ASHVFRLEMTARCLRGQWESHTALDRQSSLQFSTSTLKRLPMKPKTSSTEGRFAYEGLDRVIHERARLSILTSLITNPKPLTFGDLKELCALTDGNLSRHLRVLE